MPGVPAGGLGERQHTEGEMSDPQQGLPHIGALLRDEAIDRVEMHAAEEWRADALRAVEACALARGYFTTDHVWALLEAAESTGTHEPRAMGAIMRKAANEGYCERTNVTQQSKRPRCHRRPVRVWRSLVYRGKP